MNKVVPKKNKKKQISIKKHLEIIKELTAKQEEFVVTCLNDKKRFSDQLQSIEKRNKRNDTFLWVKIVLGVMFTLLFLFGVINVEQLNGIGKLLFM